MCRGEPAKVRHQTAEVPVAARQHRMAGFDALQRDSADVGSRCRACTSESAMLPRMLIRPSRAASSAVYDDVSSGQFAQDIDGWGPFGGLECRTRPQGDAVRVTEL